MMYSFIFIDTMMITYFICHLLGVSSCCSNPILYGFLNPNLLKVFHQFSNKIVRLTFKRTYQDNTFLQVGGTRQIKPEGEVSLSLYELRTHKRMSRRLSRLISRRQLKETSSNITNNRAVLQTKEFDSFSFQNAVTAV